MDFSLLNLLEEETTESMGIFSSGNRLTLILTAGIIIVTAIAVYLLVYNQKLAKKIKEYQEEKE